MPRQHVFVLDSYGVADDDLEDYHAVFNPLSTLNPGSRTLLDDADADGTVRVDRPTGRSGAFWAVVAMIIAFALTALTLQLPITLPCARVGSSAI